MLICGGPLDEATFCLVAVSDAGEGPAAAAITRRLGARFYSTVVRLDFPDGFVVTCPPCVVPKVTAPRLSVVDGQAREALRAAGFGPDGRPLQAAGCNGRTRPLCARRRGLRRSGSRNCRRVDSGSSLGLEGQRYLVDSRAYRQQRGARLGSHVYPRTPGITRVTTRSSRTPVGPRRSTLSSPTSIRIPSPFSLR